MENNNLVFLDTETTGITENDQIVQLAYKVVNLKTKESELVNELFYPGMPIPIEAMATHHITNKMVEGLPRFDSNNPLHLKLENLLNKNDTVLVAHNAQFDVGFLNRAGIKPKRVICTLKVARHLDSKGIIPSYSLQYLRYFLGLEVEAVAHNALGDILVLEQLYYRLAKKVLEITTMPFPVEDDAILEMVEISKRPSVIKKFNFGKYKGKTVEEISNLDKEYLKWLFTEKQKQPQGEEDWLFTLKQFIK